MRRFIILASVLLLIGGCFRTAPLYNVENAAVFTGSGKAASKADVRKAIVQALAAKAWRVKKSGANSFEASNGVKTSKALIKISYSSKNYSIIYKDSTKFSYGDGKIHKRYNHWIRTLQTSIDRNLALL